MKKRFILITAAVMLLTMMASTRTMWGQMRATTILTLDCVTPAPTGSTSTALSNTSAIATFLNSAAGLSSAQDTITCSAKSGDVYKGKGSGGGDIPQQCLKVGKASGGGSFTFTIPDTFDSINVVEITCYGWKTSSSISINGGFAQTFDTAQIQKTKTFELANSTRTITVSVTSSAVCITQIVLKKNDTPTCVTPTFSPAAGTFYTNQSVTISTTTDDATIYYTTDGSVPTTSSSVYSSAVSVNVTTTIKAIAVKDGYNNSSVASATFTLKVATPTFTPIAGSYESTQNVTISSSTEGATIYYTTDGTDPTNTSTPYTSAISVGTNTTIKAIAVKENWSNSNVASATYTIATITPATLPFTWAGGTSDALLATTGVTAYGLGSDYSDATYKIKFDDTDDFIQVKTDSQPAKVTIGVKMLGGSNTSKITVKASTDGISYDEGEELTISGSQNDVVNLETTRSFGSAVRYVRLVFTKGSNVGVGPIGITDNTPSISLNNYSINATSASENGTLIATYTNIDFTNTPEVLFYELDGTTPATYDWLTAVVNDVTHNVDYTINENTVGMRTAYFKVYGLATTSGDDVYSELVTVSQDTKIITGSINFGSASGSTKINETSVTGDDSMGNTWTITSDFSGGSTSFSQNAAYSQVGASSKPATSITFTTTLAESVTIADFQAKFGGFSSTAGTVTLKVGETTVGTGSLNASNDVVVGNSSTASGTTLTVTVTDIAKGVKCYYISYTLLTYDIYGSTTITNFTIPVGETLTIHDGGVLTVTGTLTNSGTAANLVIKDGAQLISGPVQGTMQKEITAYTPGGVVNDNWKLIASPLASASVDIATIDNYDLYVYDESTHHWLNERVPANSITNFTPGRGYLYANEANQTLEFAGQLNYSTFAGYPLSFAGEGIFKGLNLVSNPRAYQNDMWISASGVAVGNVNYLMMKADGTGFTAGTTDATGKISVLPLRGLFVQATATGQTWVDGSTVLSKGTDKSENTENSGILTLNIHGNGSLIDNAIVRLGKGHNLGKVVLNENSTKLYISQGSNEYAIVRSAAQGELPVNFKAAENGTYTLSFEVENTEMNYLHLIDKLTGNDIDLLATPEYTFSAKRGDGENRFRLVFEANGNALVTSNEPFAYFNGSEWVIENDGNATLQVIDVMGRMLRSENVSGNATTSLPNLSAGVYVLRLVNSESIRTQKVVIE